MSSRPPRKRRRGSSRHEVDLTVGGPHSVLAALAQSGRVERVFVETDGRSSRAAEVESAARRAGVAVSPVGRGECDRLCGTKAQGAAARIRFHYADLDELLRATSGLIVFLDGVEDPQNFGAIVRTAEATGSLGVVIPGHRSAEVTATVVRASAGAALNLPIARPANLAGAIHKARDAGFWVIGLDHRAERLVEPQRPGSKSALVLGGEGRGLGRLVREICDELARIPMRGRVESLNAAVAAAVAIYRCQSGVLFGSPVLTPIHPVDK